MNKTVIIVGAGQAAASFASRHVSLGNALPLVIIGEEPNAPYQRPPLSKKYLSGGMEHERLSIRRPDWYGKNSITTHFGRRVIAIRPYERRVITDDSQSIEYYKLVICTGSHARGLPKEIGGTLEGVFTLRTISDAARISAALQSGNKLLIIGGGYIGLEVAATARKLGLEVTLVEMTERILQRVAAEETSSFFRKLHTRHGVTLLEAKRLVRLADNSGRVCGAEFESGEFIKTDSVLVGIGAQPNSELAESAGLICKNGIFVSENCQTSDPNIYAAGDCTSFIRKGKTIRLESVQNAADQGDLVARVLAGHDSRYTAVPWFWSEQYDCRLQIAGLNHGYDRTVIRHNVETASYSVWYFADDRLLAVDAMNDTKSYAYGRRLIEKGIHPTPNQVADEKTSLKDLI